MNPTNEQIEAAARSIYEDEYEGLFWVGLNDASFVDRVTRSRFQSIARAALRAAFGAVGDQPTPARDSLHEIGEAARIVIEQANRDHAHLTPSSILLLGKIRSLARAAVLAGPDKEGTDD